ncbi:MAG: 2-phosphosulfolactate phosphatase [Limisphaerales bacterium]
MTIDVGMGPADFERLAGRALPGIVCVVFDVLRATSSAAMALANGAEAILPVATVEEALEAGRHDARLLLAGEREGIRIGAALTGGREFDFGNSPREFVRERVGGRRIAMTTTNGTRAIRACAGAEGVLAGSFLNLTAVGTAAAAAAMVRRSGARGILLMGSGTGEATALEDVLAVGACCEVLGGLGDFELADAAWVARDCWDRAKPDLPGAMARARNARRLRAMPELSPDVDWCLRVDELETVPALGSDGWLRG